MYQLSTLSSLLFLLFFSGNTRDASSTASAAVGGGGGGGGQSLSNLLLSNSQHFSSHSVDPCYDEDDKPRRCVPAFVNAAFGKQVLASSTCGSPPSRLPCELSSTRSPLNSLEQGKASKHKDCTQSSYDVCNSTDPRRQHPAKHLTDLNNPSNMTCWISEPISKLQHRNASLTLSLGKKYEVTYVSLQFCTAHIDYSVSIFKSSDYGKSWTPFQYYSSQCRRVFGKTTRSVALKSNEQEPFCSDFGGQSPADPSSATRRGGPGARVAFSTLEGRPSAYDFDNSPVLQDWVTATDIRIVFHAANLPMLSTGSRPMRESGESASSSSGPGDGLRYYSLADLAVGGRCKCNGHGHRCILDGHGRLVCECRHNTAGTDCERCKPFHYDRPWARATTTDANQCVRKSDFGSIE